MCRSTKAGKSHLWLSFLLAALVLGMGAELGRRVWERVRPARAAFIADSFAPEFKVGDKAPDFAIPDRTGIRRSLSDLSGSDTLLCFTCACERCRDLQSFLSRAMSRVKSPAPEVLSVTSGIPEAEEAYRRDVPLKQVILYGEAESPVWAQYRGHPCPRVFRLKQGRIAWISPSPQSVSAEAGAIAVGAELGLASNDARRLYRSAGTPDSGG